MRKILGFHELARRIERNRPGEPTVRRALRQIAYARLGLMDEGDAALMVILLTAPRRSAPLPLFHVE